MAQTNRLSKIVNATAKLPKPVRSLVWSQAFGRAVPLVGTANIRFLEVTPAKLVVQLQNQSKVQNHIKGVHAAAMALLAETATGFITALHVPDDRILLIKSLHVDYLKLTRGALTATATLSKEQQQLIHEQEEGELRVPVVVNDESLESPIQCEMVWAWRPKRDK